jgi:major membrane immunogen (membrane-anchored lipoprotein)
MIRRLMMALALMVVTIFLLGNMASVFAESGWAKNHPRRHEVNKRLKNQNRRINSKVKDGKMTKVQARNLHKEDRNMRQEERVMAIQNSGHITKQEQRTLNQQENKNSREIRN